MLSQRLLLGPVLALALLAALWLDHVLDGLALPASLSGLLGRSTFPPGMVLTPIAALTGVAAAVELSEILRAKGLVTSRLIHAVAALLGLVVATFVPAWVDGVQAVAIAGTAAMAVLTLSLVYYARHQSLEGVIAGAGGALLSFVYLGLMFGFLILIRREHSAWVLLWVLLTTKSCDIGAYFTGRSIGRHKLIRWLSPGKTWEGLVGGIVSSAAVGAIGGWMLAAWASIAVPGPAAGAVIGAVLGLTGQLGDLLASALKRDAGQKDSGRSLPGFGGVIDVIDSPLLTVPVAYWMLMAVQTL